MSKSVQRFKSMSAEREQGKVPLGPLNTQQRDKASVTFAYPAHRSTPTQSNFGPLCSDIVDDSSSADKSSICYDAARIEIHLD